MKIHPALQAGCSILYPEDIQHGKKIEGQLKLVNPFGDEGHKLTSRMLPNEGKRIVRVK